MKKTVVILVAIVILSTILSSCKKEEEIEIDESCLRSIFELATLDCYYNNVAKITKEKNNAWQKDREMWIEYEGAATIGIDMNKVQIEINNDIVNITLPKAEVTNIRIVTESFNEESYYISEDGLIKNKITAEDQQKAVEKAQKEMERTAKSDQKLMAKAENRAKSLIKSYINEIGAITDTDYQVIWKSSEK